MLNRKKKIFMILCYLLVIAALWGTISWARYKKDLEAVVVIPQAADFQASLQLGDPEDKIETILTRFRPGETALDNQIKNQHGLAFTVNNASIPAQGETKEISETPLGYPIRVYGKGNMPLSARLYDVDGEKTYEGAWVKRDEGGFFAFEVTDAAGTREKEFQLPELTYQENDFILYLGWKAADNTDDYDDRKYMKEVERLEIRATVRAGSTAQELPQTPPSAHEEPLLKKESAAEGTGE